MTSTGLSEAAQTTGRSDPSTSRAAGPTYGTILALVVAAMAAVVAWICYGRADMSLDEAYTTSEAKLSFTSLLHVIWGRELNGSLHTLLIWVLARVPGGDHITVVQGLSTLFAVAALVLLYPVLRDVSRPVPALVALAFVAANPLILEQMVNGRTYALTTLLVVVSLRILLSATARDSIHLFLTWGVLNGVMLYGHFLTAPMIAAEVVWLLIAHRRIWREWVGGAAITMFLALPIGVFLASGGSRQHQLAPSPAKSLHDYASGALALIAGGANGERIIEILATILVLVCVWYAIRRQGPTSITALGILTVAFPFVFAAADARFSPSIFSPGYLIVTLPGLAIVLAVGLGAMRDRLLAVVAVSLVVVALLGSAIAGYRRVTETWTLRHGWTAVAALLARESKPGDIVTTMVPFDGYEARIYITGQGLSFVPSFPHSGQAFLDQSTYGDRNCPSSDTGSRSIWVISAMNPHFDTDLPRYAACGHLHITSRKQVGYVRIALLTPLRS